VVATSNASHEAALGPVHRRTADCDGAHDRFVTGPGVGRQQDLRPLQLARRMLASSQQRDKLVALGLAQIDPIPYIHPDLLCGRPDESNDES
jgi:hypothetical protein